MMGLAAICIKSRANDRQRQPQILRFLLLLVGSGFSFCAANFRNECLGYGRNWHFAHQQRPSCDPMSVYRVPGITVLAERCTGQREPSERTFGAGVGQYLRIQFPIRTGRGMPSNWTSCRGSVPSHLEITREQPLHCFVVLKDHYHVHSFYTDLQSPTPARDRDERRRAPAIRGPTGCHAFASFSSEDKTTLDHVGYHGHALCVLQHFLRDSLVWHSHNFVHYTRRVVQSVGGIFPRRSCPAQRSETQHRKCEHYFFHG